LLIFKHSIAFIFKKVILVSCEKSLFMLRLKLES
jgi:hypothetical protein